MKMSKVDRNCNSVEKLLLFDRDQTKIDAMDLERTYTYIRNIMKVMRLKFIIIHIDI